MKLAPSSQLNSSTNPMKLAHSPQLNSSTNVNSIIKTVWGPGLGTGSWDLVLGPGLGTGSWVKFCHSEKGAEKGTSKGNISITNALKDMQFSMTGRPRRVLKVCTHAILPYMDSFP